MSTGKIIDTVSRMQSQRTDKLKSVLRTVADLYLMYDLMKLVLNSATHCKLVKYLQSWSDMSLYNIYEFLLVI